MPRVYRARPPRAAARTGTLVAMPAAHVPVLLEEVIRLLDPREGETAVDCTAGLGGHAEAIAVRLGPTGTLVIFDLDAGNLEASRSRIAALPRAPRIIACRANFAEAPRRLVEAGLAANVVLADLGFASNQVDDPNRGLSFSRDGPLDMRLDPSGPVTAANLVATLSERELAEIIREYGEERHAARVAQKLVHERQVQPIQTTARLAGIVRSVVGRTPKGSTHIHSSIDPATRTFQALRIAVNDEQANLRSLLDGIERGARAAPSGSGAWIAPGARVGIIAFHSLEDRPVKQSFARMAERGLAVVRTKKPVTAGEDETAMNPRSRSAKLRVVEVAGSG